jgi:hypothetical protein
VSQVKAGPIAFAGCRVVEQVEGGTGVLQSIAGEGGFFRVAPSIISNILG